MRLKPQYLFVVILVGVLVIAFAIGTVANRGKSGSAEAKTAQAGKTELPTVQAVLTPEVAREYDVVIRGRTEAARSVITRAESAGVVAATPAVWMPIDQSGPAPGGILMAMAATAGGMKAVRMVWL